MDRFKQGLLAIDLAYWQKGVIFAIVVFFSIFPFYITCSAVMPDLEAGLWQLRYFLGMAGMQSIAQLSVDWYILKNQVPNYVNLGLIMMVLFFQVTYGISVILISNA